ncbi:MAG: hypothetical protein IIC67_05230 [Thaumarchaeota archaeon]|nr:hypothetical protein [Nitrososphaerota archaeon]
MKKKKISKAYIFGPILWAWGTNNSLDAVISVNDKRYIQSILEGHRGLSPELIVRKIGCSICRQNYEDCNHIAGETYDGKECICLMEEFEALNVTAVTHPEEPRSKVTDMLVFEDDGRSYTWHGFETVNDNQRFKHIDMALKNGYITEKAALKFSTFFITENTGKIKYP